MHRSSRTLRSALAVAGPKNHPSVSLDRSVRPRSRVLLITRDRNLKARLSQPFLDLAGDTLTIEYLERVSEATVRSVIHMGQSLHLTVVAEGVETLDQLNFLQAYDCAEGQGYFFSKPVDSSQFEALISAKDPHWGGQFSAAALRGSK